ncbi:MAG: FAD-dependent oxidoreductase [Solirubrobacterales bacterium]
MPDLILPDSPEFDSVRLAWNLAADQKPAAIVVATTIEEIQDAIGWASEQGLKVAPQTTGHGAGALGDLSGCLLLKVNLHDSNINIDSTTVTARIPAGASVGDVVNSAAEHGFAFLHGSSPTIGAIGYLLGGGLSLYGRTYGLACNHVASIEMVTEDGELVKADPVINPDLFWALRGGGAGLGVVTAVEVDLLSMSEVFAGITFLPADAAPEMLNAWLGWTRNAPDSVTSIFRIMRLPPSEEIPEPLRGQTVVCIDGVSLDHSVGDELAALTESVANPIMGGWGTQPVQDLVRLHGDPEMPTPAVGDSMLLGSLDDVAARAFLDAAGPESPSTLIIAEIRHNGGVLGEPAEDGGALDHLDGEYILNGIGLAAGPDLAAKGIADLDQLTASMSPWGTGSKYLNFVERGFELSDCLPEDVVQRLDTVRDQYSPQRLILTPWPSART